MIMQELSEEFFGIEWWKKPSPFAVTGVWDDGDYSAQVIPEGEVRLVPCFHEGCGNTASTREQLRPDSVYACHLHTDEATDDVRFQSHQFDQELDGE